MSNTGAKKLAAAITAAVKSKTPGRPDWHDAVSDTLADMEEVLRHAEAGRPADAAMAARLAIGSLAGIWLAADERDAIIGRLDG